MVPNCTLLLILNLLLLAVTNSDHQHSFYTLEQQLKAPQRTNYLCLFLLLNLHSINIKKYDKISYLSYIR